MPISFLCVLSELSPYSKYLLMWQFLNLVKVKVEKQKGAVLLHICVFYAFLCVILKRTPSIRLKKQQTRQLNRETSVRIPQRNRSSFYLVFAKKGNGKFLYYFTFLCIYFTCFLFFSCMGIREFIAPNVTVDNFVPVKLKATIYR